MKKIKTLAVVGWHWNGRPPTYFNYFISRMTLGGNERYEMP